MVTRQAALMTTGENRIMPKMRALFMTIVIGWAFISCGTHSNNVPRTTATVTSSPYLFFGWGNPPDPVVVMKETGVKAFTLAFILSGNGCDPAWDGERPLDGDDATQIKRIRDAGGDVVVSMGGSAQEGRKLGEVCPNEQSLANAYQKVIDAYQLKAVDVDIEKGEFKSHEAQDRELGALKILKQRNPGLKTTLVFPTERTGPSDLGKRLIRRAHELGANVDVFTIMPFNFGGTDMTRDTISATEGLVSEIADAFAIPIEEAYQKAGISSKNGGLEETVRLADFHNFLDYANDRRLGRFTFWAVNRDRPGDPSHDAGSGIPQRDWDFTRVVARYRSTEP
ncbi:chitinase [Saccharopolyspora elongata]|uniref:Chitinase n=1 Tax=Saccharopolyspora elongata TaxID=2530387 RepID=A0A4R4XSI9_9PSEU|nr:chitinase [Saccharopolyspora elongata]